MIRCSYDGCRWQSIAPSEEAAQEQYATHLVEAHTTEVDAEIPDGMVQVKMDAADDWRTMTPEQAAAFHRAVHEADD